MKEFDTHRTRQMAWVLINRSTEPLHLGAVSKRLEEACEEIEKLRAVISHFSRRTDDVGQIARAALGRSQDNVQRSARD